MGKGLYYFWSTTFDYYCIWLPENFNIVHNFCFLQGEVFIFGVHISCTFRCHPQLPFCDLDPLDLEDTCHSVLEIHILTQKLLSNIFLCLLERCLLLLMNFKCSGFHRLRLAKLNEEMKESEDYLGSNPGSYPVALFNLKQFEVLEVSSDDSCGRELYSSRRRHIYETCTDSLFVNMSLFSLLYLHMCYHSVWDFF